jgi:hypothetical protein
LPYWFWNFIWFFWGEGGTGFELRALHLLDRHSTTWVIPQPSSAILKLKYYFCYLFQ